jgi:hypothetical protein
MPTDDAFRQALRDLLERSGLSMRGLSLTMGRDQGYVQSLLDPNRPSRARPTPADLLRLADATGLSFVGLIESLWGIPLARLVPEARDATASSSVAASLARLPAADRRFVGRLIDFLVADGRVPRPGAPAARPDRRRRGGPA